MRVILEVLDVLLTITLAVVCSWGAVVVCGDRTPLPALVGLLAGIVLATVVRNLIAFYMRSDK